jgi:predicted regulator of Ras-like GTPase activity (Roadblock/LC7/MglB family)
MTHVFDDAARGGVLRHMNGDHAEDNLLIAQAFGPAVEIVAASMAGFDGDGGRWIARLADGTATEIAVAWPSGPITERSEVRREIIALYDEACQRLGVQARHHT